MTRKELFNNVSWVAALTAGLILILFTKAPGGEVFNVFAVIAGLGPVGFAVYLAKSGDRAVRLNLSDSVSKWLESVVPLLFLGPMYSIFCMAVFGWPLAFVFLSEYGFKLSIPEKTLWNLIGLTNLIQPLYWYFKLPRARTTEGSN